MGVMRSKPDMLTIGHRSPLRAFCVFGYVDMDQGLGAICSRFVAVNNKRPLFTRYGAEMIERVTGMHSELWTYLDVKSLRKRNNPGLDD